LVGHWNLCLIYRNIFLSKYCVQKCLGCCGPKFAYGGLILSLRVFSQLPQLPWKTKLDSKVVKIDSKIIISVLESKSMILKSRISVKILREFVCEGFHLPWAIQIETWKNFFCLIEIKRNPYWSKGPFK